MKIKTASSYNLDMLCFLNIMTADPYYTTLHPKEFDTFYPLIHHETKNKIKEMIRLQGFSMLAPTFTLLLSSLHNFNQRELTEMLTSHAEIEQSMNRTPYTFAREEFDMYFSFFQTSVIPLIKELESLNFYAYWKTEKLPLIKERQAQLKKYLDQYDVGKIIRLFQKIDNSDCTVYICSFAKPHGIKLCGNNLITDISHTNLKVLSNVTHEIFHPAFDFKVVRKSLRELAAIPWVLQAFENQNPNSGYYDIHGFIEEHIVEALGIYVLVQLGENIDPYQYFKEHDGGSHVLSPHFYKYLCANKKEPSQTFEDYFTKFTEKLIAGMNT